MLLPLSSLAACAVQGSTARWCCLCCWFDCWRRCKVLLQGAVLWCFGAGRCEVVLFAPLSMATGAAAGYRMLLLEGVAVLCRCLLDAAARYRCMIVPSFMAVSM